MSFSFEGLNKKQKTKKLKGFDWVIKLSFIVYIKITFPDLSLMTDYLLLTFDYKDIGMYS